jgi:hypothetical protein
MFATLMMTRFSTGLPVSCSCLPASRIYGAATSNMIEMSMTVVMRHNGLITCTNQSERRRVMNFDHGIPLFIAYLMCHTILLVMQ